MVNTRLGAKAADAAECATEEQRAEEIVEVAAFAADSAGGSSEAVETADVSTVAMGPVGASGYASADSNRCHEKEGEDMNGDWGGAGDEHGVPNTTTAKEASREYAVYPPHIAYKVYDMGLKEVRCKSVGDSSFFSAKRAWDRLVRDFPVQESTKRRLLPHAFDGDARIVFEQVANSNLNAEVEVLWELLQ
eukprot:IDg1221t1